MALPELKVGKRYGFELTDYYGKKFREFANNPLPADERPNRLNKEALGDVNVYLAKSKELLIKLFIVGKLMEQTDASRYINTNVWQLLASVKKQRRLVGIAKEKLKHHGLNHEWAKLMKYQYDKNMERIDYVENVILKENIKMTELSLYMKELEKQGITFMEDAEIRLDWQGLTDTYDKEHYNSEWDSAQKYIGHIKDVVKRNTVTEEEKMEYFIMRERHLEAIKEKKRLKDEEKEKLFQKRYKECCDELTGMTYCVEKAFINRYKNSRSVRLQNVFRKMENDDDFAVFYCERLYRKNGFESNNRKGKYLSGYEDRISLSGDIEKAVVVPKKDISMVESKLKAENIAYGICFLGRERLMHIFDNTSWAV